MVVKIIKGKKTTLLMINKAFKATRLNVKKPPIFATLTRPQKSAAHPAKGRVKM